MPCESNKNYNNKNKTKVQGCFDTLKFKNMHKMHIIKRLTVNQNYKKKNQNNHQKRII